MHPHERARVRGRSYELFARLFREGWTSGIQPALQSVPDLAAALPRVPDPAAAAAAHRRLFEQGVSPFASDFLEASAHAGGEVTTYVHRRYRRLGAPALEEDETADHVAHELHFLSYCCGVESEALLYGRAEVADRTRCLARRFLDAHVLWWLPAFVQAVQGQGQVFYSVLAGHTLDLVLEHRAGLGWVDAAPDPPLPVPPRTPHACEALATHLATPVWGGLYVGPQELTRLARAADLPQPGDERDRRQALSKLLDAAVRRERLGALLGGLGALIDAWQAHYEVLARRDIPGIEEKAQYWLGRLAATRCAVEGLEARLLVPVERTKG